MKVAIEGFVAVAGVANTLFPEQEDGSESIEPMLQNLKSKKPNAFGMPIQSHPNTTVLYLMQNCDVLFFFFFFKQSFSIAY